MKKIKTLLLAIALCFGISNLTQAQSKVAHINAQELMAAMPEMKVAQAELETLGKNFQKDFQAMGAEYQTTVKKYEAEAEKQTPEENQKRAIELQEKQQRIQQFQSDAQEQLTKKQEELLRPISDKAKAAILKVGRAQGYDYVLDSSVGVTILSDGKNLLDDVKKELGI